MILKLPVKKNLFLSEMMDSKSYAWFTVAQGQEEPCHLIGDINLGHTHQSFERKQPIQKMGRAEFVTLVSFHLRERLINVKINFMWLSTSTEFICCKRIMVISAASTTIQIFSGICDFQRCLCYLGISPSEYLFLKNMVFNSFDLTFMS